MNRNEFWGRVAEAGQEILRKAAAAGEIVIKPKLVVAGKDVPAPIKLRRPLRREEQYTQRLHEATTEVFESYEAMRNVELYLSRLAFSRDGVRASSYIRFQLESYLNETYILRERMKAA